MIFSVYGQGYDDIFSEEVLDIKDNFKYANAFQMCNEATIILSERYNYEKLSEASNGFWTNFKAKIKALIDTIKNLWDKFRYKIEQMFTSDIEWVNQYGSALLKAKIPAGTYSMYGYPNNKQFMTKLFASNIFPPYNPEDSRLFNALESPEKFRETYTPQFITKNKDMNYSEGIKYMARGNMTEPEDYDNTAIARFLPDMIQYCKDYPKLAATLKREKTTLETSINKILRDIDKIKVEDKGQAQQPKQDDTTKPAGGAKPKAQEAKIDTTTPKKEPKDVTPKSENFFIMVEGCNYSELALNERIEVLNEAPGLKVTPATNGKQDTVAKTDDGKVGVVPSSVSKEDDKSDISKRYNTYIVEVFNFIGVRMTVAEEQFSTYMQVLKYIAKASGITVKDKTVQTGEKKVTATPEPQPKAETKKARTLKGDAINLADKAKDKVSSFARYMSGNVKK